MKNLDLKIIIIFSLYETFAFKIACILTEEKKIESSRMILDRTEMYKAISGYSPFKDIVTWSTVFLKYEK